MTLDEALTQTAGIYSYKVAAAADGGDYHEAQLVMEVRKVCRSILK